MAGQNVGGTGLSGLETMGVLLTSPDPFKTLIEQRQTQQARGAIGNAVNAYTNPNLVTDPAGATFDKSLMMMDPAKVDQLPPATQQSRGRMALEALAASPVTAGMVAKQVTENALPSNTQRYREVGNQIVDTLAEGGPRSVYSAPTQLPASIQEALFVNNGDLEKTQSYLKTKGMDGEWAIGPNGKTGYFPKSMLMDPANSGAYQKVPNGIKAVVGPDGTVTFATGDQASSLTTPVKTDLQKDLIAGQDAVARLESIKASFKPEYQQLGTRWSALAQSAKEKAGFSLDPASQKSLSDYSAFLRDTAANTNQTIKDLTGATVGESEAPRLMLQMPVAGQGLFDGDSPTQFQTKLDGTLKSLRAANARKAFALKNGLDKAAMFAIPLDTIPSLIDKKGSEYAAQLKQQNPTAPPEQIREMVKVRLRQEFNL